MRMTVHAVSGGSMGDRRPSNTVFTAPSNNVRALKNPFSGWGLTSAARDLGINLRRAPKYCPRLSGPSEPADAGAPSPRRRNLFSPLAPAGGRALARWAAAAAIAVLAPGFSPAAEGAGGLFAAAGRVAVPADAGVLRSRVVTLDAGMLDRARAFVARRAQTQAARSPDRFESAASEAQSTAGRAAEPTLVLNLFEDVAFRAHVESEAPTFSGGYSLSGRLAGEPLGSVTLVVNGDIVAGTVRTVRGTYSIETAAGGLYAVSELDPSRLAVHCAVQTLPPRSGEDAPPQRR